MTEHIRQSITAWFEKKQTSSVILLENLNPDNEQYEDYHISYEVVFEPSSLDQACVELWVTDKGYVGIGFEKRGRVAGRLNVPCRRGGFSAGYEPLSISIEALLANLESVARGKVALNVTVLPWVGLVRTKAIMLDEDFVLLSSQDKNVKYWLSSVQNFKSNFISRNLQFSPWN